MLIIEQGQSRYYKQHEDDGLFLRENVIIILKKNIYTITIKIHKKQIERNEEEEEEYTETYMHSKIEYIYIYIF